ncbi:MAG TPA: CBASS cGAMP-activated phospholipase [Phycisphaerae bacterium]|nr:CBASS cGAMP-activated phospholipase [Phycisphaerae bacterium]
MSKPFYILSIDGGGYRGLYSAHVLRRMEEAWGINWHTQFGMFAGTSTGSIIAAGLASGISAAQLSDFYINHGKRIFTRRWRSRFDLLKIFTSRYSGKTLRALLVEVLGTTTLGDVRVPLILPAVDIGNGCVHVFKSKYADGFIRDPGVKLSDAVLASCSAPTYFDPHFVDDIYQLVDGGLWANNPSLVAAIDAHYRLQVPLANIRVLSIGTGKSRVFYAKTEGFWKDWLVRSWQGWGFASRWQSSKLLDLILNLQADTAHNMLCLLFGESPITPKRVFRLTFESDSHLPMDSVRHFADWITKADHCFTHQSPKLKQFLNLNGGAD